MKWFLLQLVIFFREHQFTFLSGAQMTHGLLTSVLMSKSPSRTWSFQSCASGHVLSFIMNLFTLPFTSCKCTGSAIQEVNAASILCCTCDKLKLLTLNFFGTTQIFKLLNQSIVFSLYWITLCNSSNSPIFFTAKKRMLLTYWFMKDNLFTNWRYYGHSIL